MMWMSAEQQSWKQGARTLQLPKMWSPPRLSPEPRKALTRRNRHRRSRRTRSQPLVQVCLVENMSSSRNGGRDGCSLVGSTASSPRLRDARSGKGAIGCKQPKFRRSKGRVEEVGGQPSQSSARAVSDMISIREVGLDGLSGVTTTTTGTNGSAGFPSLSLSPYDSAQLGSTCGENKDVHSFASKERSQPTRST